MAKPNQIDLKRIKVKNIKNETSLKKHNNKDVLWYNREIRFTTKKPGNKFKESFYNELYSLLGSGIDIIEAIKLISNDNLKFKDILRSLTNKILEGLTLSGAMISVGVFSKYEYYSVQIGEETGKVKEVLKELAIYYGKLTKQNRQIISSLTYPFIVLLVAFSAVYFMISFVVPMFSDVFKQFGGELPVITKFVIYIADIFGTYFIYIFFGLTFLTLFFIYKRKTIWFRKYSAVFLLEMPVVGNLVKKIFLSRFLFTMSMLMDSKVPLVQATELCKKMILFYPIEISLGKIEKELIHGASLSKCLEMHPIFPTKLIAMVRVGEEVNQVDSFLKKLSDQYSAEVEFITESIGKIIEPIIIIVLGAIVAVIMIAMYLPLFQIGNTF